MEEAEAAWDAFTLRRHILALAARRQELSRELEGRFLDLCRKLQSQMRAVMPAA